MKNKIQRIIGAVLVVAVSLSIFAAGCFGSVSNESTPKEFTIQYTDGSGTHQFTVTDKMPYSIKDLPEKTGYDFMGLYDSENGGVQYVSASGASLTPFNDGKNLVLFPQFEAKTFNLILDYQGAEVIGERQLKATYGENLPQLPQNLTLDHSEFTGWYTAEQCGGVRVADKYGLVPLVSVLNETNFDISKEYINLYAGFEAAKYSVTCHFGTGIEDETLQVAYGTPVSGIAPETRVKGKAPISWSETDGGEVFSGKITEDIDLYALEYAPVIELDTNGGSAVTAVISRAGTSVNLPTPEKELSKFLYWADENGNEFIQTVMPENGAALKAVWQAKIEFDENGGEEVVDISKKAGESIYLPKPERDGYIFAGWYTTDKNEYTSTQMSAVGLKLKAGWYKTEIYNRHVTWGEKHSIEYSVSNQHINSKQVLFITCDFSTVLNENFNGKIKMEVFLQLRNTGASLSRKATFNLFFYSSDMVSTEYYICEKSFTITSDKYVNHKFDFETVLKGNKMYVARSGIDNSYGLAYFYMNDFYYNLYYPDTSNLYL